MMSKSSPIYISDDSEDEKEKNCSDHVFVDVFSEDDNSMPGTFFKHFAPLTPVKVKREAEETTPTKSPLNVSSKIKINVDKNRLKWLSGVIKLGSVSPVKNESSTCDGVCTATSKAVKHLEPSSSYRVPQEPEKEDSKDHLQVQDIGDQLLQPSRSFRVPQETEKEDSKDHLQVPDIEDHLLQPSSSFRVPQETEKEDHKDHLQPSSKSRNEESLPSLPWSHSTLSYKNSPDKTTFCSRTPKKSNLQKAIESPRKVGIFGSPQKALKQMFISEEFFSPKKSMKSPSEKIEDTSHHTTPLHACHFNGYVCAHKLERPVLTFSEFQLIVLEGIKEEGLVAKYIDTLISYVSKYRKPPPEICFYLLSEVLLKSDTISLATKCFWALKRIQALHPSVPEQMEKTGVTWETIELIVERMELTGCRCKKSEDSNDQPCVRSFSAFKALAFLINIMESEAVRKQFCLRRTIAFRLLSVQRISSRNVNQVVWWIKELCMATLHCKKKDPTAESKVFETITYHDACIHKKENYLYQAIGLFQRLIQLSLSVSEDPESCATKLVGELLFAYNQLEHLECRTIFLQSIVSHLLRSKFLEKYLEVYCKDTEANRNISHYSGIQKIVQVDFERLPQKRDHLSEDTSDARKCHEWHRGQEDCEEMSMVLSYSLQSYLFSHHKKLQCSPKRIPLTSKGEEESNKKQANSHHLSITDVDEICNMGDKVVIMAGRLMSLCPEASLNARTNQLIELLSDMKLWDPW